MQPPLTPFDSRDVVKGASAIAKAAINEGVATVTSIDLAEYEADLGKRLNVS